MKGNTKGLGGIKGLLLKHGEKVVIAAAILCVVMLIVKSMGRERLPDSKQPEELQKQITQVRTDVTSFDWSKAVAEHPDEVRLVKPVSEKAATEIQRGAYDNPNGRRGWDPAVVPPTVLRTDPVMLVVQDVEVSSGSGLLSFTNDDIRKKREIARQLAQQQQAAAQQKQAEKEAKASESGKPGGRTGRDAAKANAYEDPLHPNRRLVTNITRPLGVPQQEDEEVKTAYWAVVVAKVPIKEQIKLYHDAFQNARGYNPNSDDMPMYLGYVVERAEVSSNQQELQWAPVYVTNGKGEKLSRFVNSDVLYGVPSSDGTSAGKRGVVTDWAVQVPEVVDPRYLDPSGVLAFPLAPLIGRDWAKDVTHTEIPLATDAPAADEQAKPTTEEVKPGAPGDEDVFRAGTAERSNVGGRQSVGRSGGYGGPGLGGRGEMGEGRGMPFRGGGGEYGGRMPQGEGGGMYSRGGMGSTVAPEVSSWLFRFFDFTVEPGKKYRYRVKLAIQDPNQAPGVLIDTLAPDVVKRVKDEKAKRNPAILIPYRVTEASKPSRAISIPQAGNVHVVSAKPPAGAAMAEPETTLLVESFGDEEGKAVQAALEKKFKRGSVANMTENAEHLVDSGRGIEPLPHFNFRTGITVADIAGGDKISRDLVRPARILLMDPAGQLFVQNEVDDLEVVTMHKDMFAMPDPKNPNAGYGAPRGEAMMGERGGR